MEFDKIVNISGAYILTPSIFKDNRGGFYESYNKKDFYSNGIDCEFIQENRSFSYKRVLRGIHTQVSFPYDKMVSCIKGHIYDVIVDTRKDSPTFKHWFGIELSEMNRLQIYMPKGVAHGFLTLSDEAEISFLVSEHYHPDDEIGFIWNDDEIHINWPSMNNSYILAEKDTLWGSFHQTFG